MPQMSPLPWVGIYLTVFLMVLGLVSYLYFPSSFVHSCKPSAGLKIGSKWDW